ncbi:MAG: hypothetical protein OXF28_00685 [Thaumarchaeota archaeon]|nr:hypothetical protein [Nitrososphaerota archaeon]MCY3975638.1 hypothetical protein [Nitrososphaerota archaeon]
MVLNNWNKSNGNSSLSQKMLDKVKHTIPIKNKLDIAQKKLQFQVSKLDYIHEKLQKKSEYIFKKIINAQKINNKTYAKAYAIELTEIRKMKTMVNNAKLAMEQIQIRLNTISELGDIVVTLSPCMSIIKGLGNTLNEVVPETNYSIQDLSKTLNDVLSSSSLSSHDDVINNTNDKDTLAILEEAQSIIEKKAKDNIPELPNSLKFNKYASKSQKI